MSEKYDPQEGLRQYVASLINESMNETGELDSLGDELLAYADKIMAGLRITADWNGANRVGLSGYFYRDEK